MKKLNKDTLKEMKEETCIYPVLNEEEDGHCSCGKEKFMHFTLPLAKQLESGGLEQEGNLSVTAPFCVYHGCLVSEVSGFHLQRGGSVFT